MKNNVFSTVFGLFSLSPQCLRLCPRQQQPQPMLSALAQQTRLSSSTTGSAMPPVSDLVARSRTKSGRAGLERITDAASAPQRLHHLHVFTHKHNTHITLTRPNATVMLSLSCGNIGLRKAQRKTYDAAHQLTAHFFSMMQEKEWLDTPREEQRIKTIEVVFKGYGVGREAFTKALLGTEGKNIRPLVSKVTDATKLKFGGPRSRATRRLG